MNDSQKQGTDEIGRLIRLATWLAGATGLVAAVVLMDGWIAAGAAMGTFVVVAGLGAVVLAVRDAGPEAVRPGQTAVAQAGQIGIALLLVGGIAVAIYALTASDLGDDSSCADWNEASRDEKVDYVEHDGYRSGRDQRVDELDNICATPAFEQKTLLDLRDDHQVTDVNF